MKDHYAFVLFLQYFLTILGKLWGTIYISQQVYNCTNCSEIVEQILLTVHFTLKRSEYECHVRARGSFCNAPEIILPRFIIQVRPGYRVIWLRLRLHRSSYGWRRAENRAREKERRRGGRIREEIGQITSYIWRNTRVSVVVQIREKVRIVGRERHKARKKSLFKAWEIPARTTVLIILLHLRAREEGLLYRRSAQSE